MPKIESQIIEGEQVTGPEKMTLLFSRIIVTIVILLITYFALDRTWTREVDLIAWFKKPAESIPVKEKPTTDLPQGTKGINNNSISSNHLLDILSGKHAEKGGWTPSFSFYQSDSQKTTIIETSKKSAEYIYSQPYVKISFDISADLKEVPNGIALSLEGLPFVIGDGAIQEFDIKQHGLEINGKLAVSTIPNSTWINLVVENSKGEQEVYHTDGSEGLVRFWGNIVYETPY